MRETLPALAALKAKGLVRFVGITGLPLGLFPYVIDRAPEGSVDVVLSYCHYCLNDGRWGGCMAGGLRWEGASRGLFAELLCNPGRSVHVMLVALPLLLPGAPHAMRSLGDDALTSPHTAPPPHTHNPQPAAAGALPAGQGHRHHQRLAPVHGPTDAAGAARLASSGAPRATPRTLRCAPSALSALTPPPPRGCRRLPAAEGRKTLLAAISAPCAPLAAPSHTHQLDSPQR